ncbi:MAG: membrane glycosyltransferase [Paracoccaceae bacterium]|jgi:membrane glycosyltransferase
MPAQNLRRAPAARFGWAPWRVQAARVLSFGGALAITILGYDQMTLAFQTDGVTVLQLGLRALFVVTFGWIAFSACSALAGVLFAPRVRVIGGDAPLASRTAILMPVYEEDAAASYSALAAIGRGVAAAGQGHAFEAFILSDTRDPDAWVRETTAFAALRLVLDGAIPVFYRRRRRNVGRKSGNVQDFVERWGGRYDFMLVLDADSEMSPETIIEMVRRIEAAPDLGLLQTSPALIGGETLYSRLAQFASSVYGRPVARGVAAWQGEDGNFWGHNAVIRTAAFASAAGLPELPGRKPFGGHVMSHDFVEAALLRRAGWGVRMDHDLAGSWEGAPPSLLTAAARDRRWAQGNLQHIAILPTRGLRWPNRAHMMIGIGSYLASPLWLMLLLVGLALTAQASLMRPDFFSGPDQLFPSWPRFDAARMTTLFVCAMVLLLLPKFIGLAETALSGPRRRAHGGAGRLALSAGTELILSSLYAPIMMLMQTRHVIEILAGLDSGWLAQDRAGTTLPWRKALSAHRLHVLTGLAGIAALYFTQPEVLIWMSPVLGGLVLSPLLSRMSGDPRLEPFMARIGLCDSADARAVPRIVQDAALIAPEIRAASALGLAGLVADDAHAGAHIDALGPEGEPSAAEELAAITARAKIDASAGAFRPAIDLMTRDEMIAIAGNGDLLARWRVARAASAG